MDDLAIIVFVAVQAVALAIALGYAWSRGRTLEEIDESLRQGVTMRVLVDPDLPPVRGEAARLAQVFANLFHNTVKFSPSGREESEEGRGATFEFTIPVSDAPAGRSTERVLTAAGAGGG